MCSFFLQIIHLKRFQFCNGRWVKSQRKVRFPVSSLDPLHCTIRNGNETTADNDGTTVQPNDCHLQCSEERPEELSLPSDQRSECAAAENGSPPSSTLANGGDHPVISEDHTPNDDDTGVPGRCKNNQLDETFHHGKDCVYNLVAITVSSCSYFHSSLQSKTIAFLFKNNIHIKNDIILYMYMY